ncbi:unnamed protein product [Moneuplotes crassus]|uniref:Uncharacterized protein n=1 Tax=Euplotes crassus TaxID=5936 RepID=A0AAD1UI44_EUPCR|nr:unnamed protein product [Moneuplotes crassus]
MLIKKCKKSARGEKESKPPNKLPMKVSRNAITNTEDYSPKEEVVYAPIKQKELFMNGSKLQINLQDGGTRRTFDDNDNHYSSMHREHHDSSFNSFRYFKNSNNTTPKEKYGKIRGNICLKTEGIAKRNSDRKNFWKDWKLEKYTDERLQKQSKKLMTNTRFFKWKKDFERRLNTRSSSKNKLIDYKMSDLNKILTAKMKTKKSKKSLRLFNRIHNSVDEGKDKSNVKFREVIKGADTFSIGNNWVRNNPKQIKFKKNIPTITQKLKALPKKEIFEGHKEIFRSLDINSTTDDEEMKYRNLANENVTPKVRFCKRQKIFDQAYLNQEQWKTNLSHKLHWFNKIGNTSIIKSRRNVKIPDCI